MQQIMSDMQKTTSAALVELGHGFLPLLQCFPALTTLSTWTLPSHWSSWGNALDKVSTPGARLHLHNVLGTPWTLCTVTLCLCSSGGCQQTSRGCSQRDTAPQQFPHQTMQDRLHLGILIMCWHGKGREWELICFLLGLFNALSRTVMPPAPE